MNDTVSSILAIEWEMFHNVNGDDRADCQENRTTFEAMRNAQFSVWSEAARKSYLCDIRAAAEAGRNVVREKYIRMMASTEPEGYEAFKGELPAVSGAAEELVQQIWDILAEETEDLRQHYPMLALGGRPLYAKDEAGWASVETYQKGELFTFGEETLRLLKEHILSMRAKGESYVTEVQKNSVTCLGYPDMDTAEAAMTEQLIKELGIEISEDCPECGAGRDAAY